jgi:hypothetical protein
LSAIEEENAPRTCDKEKVRGALLSKSNGSLNIKSGA